MTYRCSECHRILRPRRYYHNDDGTYDVVLKCEVHGDGYVEWKYHNTKAMGENLNLYIKCHKPDLLKEILLFIEEKLSPYHKINKHTYQQYPKRLTVYHYHNWR